MWLIKIHYCLGKCSNRPGGGARWKDSGPRHLSWASSWETKCYWGAASTGKATSKSTVDFPALKKENQQTVFPTYFQTEHSTEYFPAALQSVCLVPQELLNRTALETQKLELMTEVSSLKLKLTAVERDHRDNEVDPYPPSQPVKWIRDSWRFQLHLHLVSFDVWLWILAATQSLF